MRRSNSFLRRHGAYTLLGVIGFSTGGLGLGLGVQGCSCSKRAPATHSAARLTSDASGSRAAEENAAQLCSALHQNPSRRRAECCAEPPVTVYFDECVRLLSSAVRASKVSIDGSKVRLCAARVNETTRGCDWVAPTLAAAPEECAGAVTGRVEEGGRCSSSLECSGALHCAGQGATTPGVCKAPQAVGSGCGTGVDSLATYLAVRALEERKPPCEDFCALTTHRCEAKPVPGAACMASVNCASDQTCKNGHCEKLEQGAREARSLPGGACTTDLDCAAGGCVTDAAGRRTCAKKCSSDLASLAAGSRLKALSLTPTHARGSTNRTSVPITR